jgi:hypothetical protein
LRHFGDTAVHAVRWPSLVPLALAAYTLACVDLAHTNPYDPETPFDVQVSGPDSAFSFQQIIPFSFTSDPEWSGPVQWKTSNDKLLHSFGDGRFAVVGFAAPPNDTASVVVLLGTHTATHRVVVTQKVAGFSFACPVRDAPCQFPRGAGNAVVNFEGHDANGFRMVGPYSVQVASTQPGVLRIDQFVAAPAGTYSVAVSPLTVGTCYFIAISGGKRDSVFVTVR